MTNMPMTEENNSHHGQHTYNSMSSSEDAVPGQSAAHSHEANSHQLDTEHAGLDTGFHRFEFLSNLKKCLKKSYEYNLPV